MGKVRMPNGMIELTRARRLIAALALGVALVCGLTPAFASAAHSSPADRQRFVSITRSLEQAPLNPGLKADREWALAWLTDAPDVSATVCAEPLGGFAQSTYTYEAEITVQDIFSMAAFV